MSNIIEDGNVIKLSGKFGMLDIHSFLGTAYYVVEKKGYQDIILDFSELTAAFPGPMITVCSRALLYRERQIDVDIVLPKQDALRRLFINTNWANLINPETQLESRFRGFTHVPAIHFRDAKEQGQAVEKILNAILSSVTEIKRKDLAAVEWAINEITDNVLVHSSSSYGGLLQLSSFNTRQKRIEYTVCDAGCGIPRSLGQVLTNKTDVELLDLAIMEGVTNGKGMGNGLFGSYETSYRSGGYFNVHSGNASLAYVHSNKVKSKFKTEKIVKNEKVPYNGTLVVSCLDYSVPHLLESALVFKGKKEVVPDSIEVLYEDFDEDQINFLLTKESETFGTRIAGAAVRNKVINLLSFHPSHFPIIINFKNVPVISSSFADEVFGKLIESIGEEQYTSRVKLIGCDSLNSMLIERAVSQRIEIHNVA